MGQFDMGRQGCHNATVREKKAFSEMLSVEQRERLRLVRLHLAPSRSILEHQEYSSGHGDDEGYPLAAEGTKPKA